MNAAYSPSECVAIAMREVERLIAKGVCDRCSVKLAANQYGINEFTLLTLYLEKSWHGPEG